MKGKPFTATRAVRIPGFTLSTGNGARCSYLSRKGRQMDTFTQAYITAALWSSSDAGEPLDKTYSIEDIAPETLTRMQEDCDKFRDDAKIMVIIAGNDEQAGHDFWLTRNHHGAGFWDGDWEEHGDTLTAHAQNFRECDLYVGDDGKLYL